MFGRSGDWEDWTMTNLKCVLGRHEWKPGVNSDDQPYEKCDNCGHYRYPDSSGSKFNRHGEPPNPGVYTVPPASGF